VPASSVHFPERHTSLEEVNNPAMPGESVEPLGMVLSLEVLAPGVGPPRPTVAVVKQPVAIGKRGDVITEQPHRAVLEDVVFIEPERDLVRPFLGPNVERAILQVEVATLDERQFLPPEDRVVPQLDRHGTPGELAVGRVSDHLFDVPL